MWPSAPRMNAYVPAGSDDPPGSTAADTANGDNAAGCAAVAGAGLVRVRIAAAPPAESLVASDITGIGNIALPGERCPGGLAALPAVGGSRGCTVPGNGPPPYRRFRSISAEMRQVHKSDYDS